MTVDSGNWLRELIEDFVTNSPENSLKMDPDEKAWDEVLVSFSSGADPLYEAYKDLVGETHWTPLEAFSIRFSDARVSPADLTVISWILPQRETTKADNRRESFYPSRRWVQARFPGEEFNNGLRRHIVQELDSKGIKSVAPILRPEWIWEKSPKYVFSSKWSERHAAYAAGLGTFGLCDGLITPKGKAHRVGSVVANLSVSPTSRPYDDHHAYCLFFFEGSCNGCRKRCPVEAITDEGHDKVKCWNHAGGTCAEFVKKNYNFDGYGCGLCQTGVPCESGIPKKILKSMNRVTPSSS
ncbi:MAG TPA: epoxyqueuosine reductase [Desulfomonilaceae bacterium]|nr:epoxyqueuosine reductase [Desulfomonilaceae bacterium]